LARLSKTAEVVGRQSPRSAAICSAFALGRLSVPDARCSCAPSLPWLRRSPHQLIDREPMVVGRADSLEGAKVNQSIAMLLLPTSLLDSALTSFTFISVYAASCDAVHAHIFAKPMPPDGVLSWVAANWRARTTICILPVASTFRISHIRVAR